MPRLCRRAAVPLAVLLMGLALALPARAQSAAVTATDTRVLFDFTDRVKDDDGTYVVLRTRLVYDPVAGEYVQTTTYGDGRLRSRDVRAVYPIGPTPEEDAAARALIAGHPELAALKRAAAHPVLVDGGFALVREEGHGCGPGSRCLQYDVFEVVPGEAFGRRLRYVVVDLRHMTIFSADFDVVREGNLAHPDARRQSTHPQ
ncbi:MAG: hypothetical protein ACK41D_00420 [Rubricoccaceae bacterium]